MTSTTANVTLSGGSVLRTFEFVVRTGLFYAAVMAWVGVFALSTRMLIDAAPVVSWMVGAAAAVAASTLVWSWRGPTNTAMQAMVRIFSSGENKRWLLLCVGLGLALRIAWAAAFPADPVSDGRIYIELARKLLAGKLYAVGETRAYWPPGYPFYLAPWLWAFESQRLAIIVSNVALFLIGASGVFALGTRLIGTVGARFALLLYAIWPNLIFQAGIPEKEQVLVSLMPWILVLWCGSRPMGGPAPGRRAVLAGLALGAAMLVQPAVQLLLVVLFVCGWVVTGDMRRSLLALACMICGMVLIVGPWTWRNLQVFDHFVPVSTNGGYGLFGANNPNATGGYLPAEQWPKDLVALSELEADREAKRRAFQWIANNPMKFALLAVEKNVRFMGDDAVGAYTTLNRNSPARSGMVYAFFKGLSNLFWLGFWWLVLCALLRLWQQGLRLKALQLVVPASFLYSFALHSVAESAGKYHVLWTGILCVLLPMLALTQATQKSTEIDPS